MYENINNISLPLKYAKIDLREYLPDTVSSDTTAMIDFEDSSAVDDNNETETEIGTARSVVNGIGDEDTEELR